MTYSDSSSVLFTSKLVTLVVASCILLFVLLNVKTPESEKTVTLSPQQRNAVNPFSDNHLFVNPFIRSDSDSVPMDLIPTVTTIVPTIKPFASLDLRLHGIVYKNNNAGYAMISMHSAMQEIYSVNSEIMEHLVLTEIAKNHVEIDYFGEQHRITIDGSTLSSELEDEHDSGMTFAEQVALVEEDHRRNPIRLLMIRRPYAVYEDGRFLGYLVMPGSNHDQFKRLGFESGDIITYLNGTAFEGPGKEGFVIAQLTHSSNIDLTVMRGEDQLNIMYGF